MSEDATPAGDQHQLSQRELAREQAEDLPDREAMSLLDLNLDIAADIDVAAPIAASVAANANVAAPIDAAVSANVIGISSNALASADQDSIIVQTLNGVANATADQDATIDQSQG